MGGTAVTGTRGLTVTGRTSPGCLLELSALSEAALRGKWKPESKDATCDEKSSGITKIKTYYKLLVSFFPFYVVKSAMFLLFR